MKLIYIVGYERSGSTILHNLLSEHPDTFGVGELRHINKRFQDNRPCACGETIYNCSFWSDLADNVKSRIADYTRDRWIILYPLLKWYFLLFRKEEVKWFEEVYKYAFEKSKNKVLIDSSKSLVHLFLLNRVLNLDVRTVFIVRNPNGILYSLKKRMEKAHKKYKNSTLNGQKKKIDWVNFVTDRITARIGNCITVKYEELVKNPQRELNNLMTHADLEKSKLHWKSTTIHLSGTHSVDGGPTRHIKGEVQLREDDQWKNDSNFNTILNGYTIRKYY